MKDVNKNNYCQQAIYPTGVLLVYQAFQLASRFVTVDTEEAPKSLCGHTVTVKHHPKPYDLEWEILN
jgi:hypothetical protein